MKVSKRKITVRLRTFEDSKRDTPFVEGTMTERVSQMWELTRDAWAMMGIDAEQRLQRNVTVLIRRKG
jgi:hypothetical protein